MRDIVKWGVLGAAKIALVKVIPGMQRGDWSDVIAIGSRDAEKAKKAADSLGIQRAYGSYEELLADPEIEAIYNPLPNHLHVPWSIRAAEAGKHVLCEKPIGLSSQECRELMVVRDRTGVKISEAFMVRVHPQWIHARDLIRSGAIGALRSIVSAFSYFNRDPQNIRNVEEWGGGALMDIGCYPVQISRFLFGSEPLRAIGAFERDPEMRIDRLISGTLDFGAGQSVFTCSTQMTPFQRVQILGTTGRIEIEIPFNAPPDKPTRIFVDEGAGFRTEEFGVCDQYTLQGDMFSKAVRGQGEVPTPLEDSLANMVVIEALFASELSKSWVEIAIG
ncbi:MAG TPA: Gfo/Idh/MocA family oxidoreductase [Bryobacteraceae bacterium]|nr:Gfo/Idh/MocA family oxidoreductase [Bryobacteraceae bacterium]